METTNCFGVAVPRPWEIVLFAEARNLAFEMVRRSLEYLSTDRAAISAAMDGMIKVLKRSHDSSSNRVMIEQNVRELLTPVLDKKELERAFRDRADLIYGQIREYVVGHTVMDYGCGDGLVGWKLRSDFEVSLSDIMDYRDNKVHELAFHMLSDEVNPASQLQNYDTVLLLTVLHHAESPLTVLNQVSKLARKAIIVIESVYGVSEEEKLMAKTNNNRALSDQFGFAQFMSMNRIEQLSYASFIDWFYNRVLHKGVNVPLNFGRPSDWTNAFAKTGFCQNHVELLGLDQPLVPEFHTLQVFTPDFR